jgi:hypothetical protein
MATLSNVDPVTHPNQSGFKGRIKPTGLTKREDKVSSRSPVIQRQY